MSEISDVVVDRARPGDDAAVAADAADRGIPDARLPQWLRTHTRLVLVADAGAVGLAATAAAALVAIPGDYEATAGIGGTTLSYWVSAAFAVPLWILVVGAGRGYEARYLGNGSEEFRRVIRGGIHFFALVSVAVFLFKLKLARSFVLGITPMAVIASITARSATRRRLRRLRRRGQASRRVLAVGSAPSVRQLLHHLERSRWAGYSVIAACVPNMTIGDELVGGGRSVPVVCAPDDVVTAVRDVGADVVAVAGSEILEPGWLRRVAWSLEGSGVDVVVAPALADVAGPRIAIYPVSGLPLLHVEEPRLSGPARLTKECFDRIAAVVALLVLGPALLVIAAATRLSSRGPAIFRQERVGHRGTRFTMYKFRTMFDGAEQARDELWSRNELDGPLFKIRRDPRVTGVGRWLRRFSIDELPQLLNVIRGQMSIVGPRPPLPDEVERYADDVRRRFLVKPGITGLWQVSGRADLPWDESVRLDLYYVENWSPTLDIVIIWKTAKAWLSGRGAY